MKILYVIDRPNLYGSEQHLFDIITYFKKENNIKLLALNQGPLLDEVIREDVACEVVKTGWISMLKKYRQLKKIIIEFEPDIIHAHQPKAVFIMSVLGRWLKIPTLITVHSKPITNAMSYHGIKSYFVYLIHWKVNFLAQLFATKVIFVSRDMLNKAFFKKKSLLIYNWVSPRFTKRKFLNGRKIQDKHNLKFVAVGSVTSAKGYDTLIDFLGYLSPTISFELDILGHGDEGYIKELDNKAKQKGIANKIHFRGFQKHLENYLLNADFFILFSKSETFGLSYADAMFFGLPIIASNLQVLREIIPDGNCLSNNFNQLKNGIKKFLDNDNLYTNISNLNQSWVQKYFNYDTNMKNLAHQYLSVVK